MIDTYAYAPYFLAAVNNALSRSASARYARDFGVGVTEWRVLSWLAGEPGSPAARICEGIALDKAAVSRAVARLETLGLVDAQALASDPRRKLLTPTATGLDLHDRILAVALDREAGLIAGVAPDDFEAFLRVMRIMRRNVESL